MCSLPTFRATVYLFKLRAATRAAPLRRRRPARAPPTQSLRRGARRPRWRRRQVSGRRTASPPTASPTSWPRLSPTLTRNHIRLRGSQASFDQLAQATPLQARAFELPIDPKRLEPESEQPQGFESAQQPGSRSFKPENFGLEHPNEGVVHVLPLELPTCSPPREAPAGCGTRHATRPNGQGSDLRCARQASSLRPSVR